MIGNTRSKPECLDLEQRGFDEMRTLTDYLGGLTQDDVANQTGIPSLLEMFVLGLALIAWSFLPAARGWI